MASLRGWTITALALSLLALPLLSRGEPRPAFSDHELHVLRAVEAVVKLFKHFPDAVWPGYDLSRRPFLVYIPDTWALLVNGPRSAPGFGPCPPGWPDLETSAQSHEGRYEDLIGQLAFDLPIGEAKVVAVGVPQGLAPQSDFPGIGLLAFIIHENFHQFQNQNFGEIPWEREERYPILDARNSALAFLEMRLLKDVLLAVAAGRKAEVQDLARRFVAVRAERWDHGRPFVRRYEQGQELQEGTAQYVQMRSTDLLKDLAGGPTGEPFPLGNEAKRFSPLACRLDDFAGRMKDWHVEPEDMIRNRVYPVGATLGLLADSLGIDWKPKAQQAGRDFAFHVLLAQALFAAGRPDPGLLLETEKRSDFERVLRATEQSILDYRRGFEGALRRFESQAGTRVEIAFSYRSLSRSGVSSARKWVMNEGALSLREKVRAYTLKNDSLGLQVLDTGVLEKDDWEGKKKSVAFFTGEITDVRADGEALDPARSFSREFREVEVEGRGFLFKARTAGTLTLAGRAASIRLH
jgi:hypothetical protein